MLQALIDSVMDGLSSKISMVSTAAFGHARLKDPIIVDTEFILRLHLFVHYLININSDQLLIQFFQFINQTKVKV